MPIGFIGDIYEIDFLYVRFQDDIIEIVISMLYRRNFSHYACVNWKIPVFFLGERLLATETKYRDFPS